MLIVHFANHPHTTDRRVHFVRLVGHVLTDDNGQALATYDLARDEWITCHNGVAPQILVVEDEEDAES